MFTEENRIIAAWRNNRVRNAYRIAAPGGDVLYIPVNRLSTPYQTEQATNWEKVRENVERMTEGQPLEPVVIGYDYDVHDGHHRLEASKLMEYTHVPCIVGGNSALEVARAYEAYNELWKSWNEAAHPRDRNGKFTTLYHTTKDKNFKYNPDYHNSKQEMGRGLYAAPHEDIPYWHRAMHDPGTGDTHPYVIPLDVSRAKLVHHQDIPKANKLAAHLMRHFGSGDNALQAIEQEEKQFITGETLGMRPFEVAQKRLYAKTGGYDGIIMHDEKEGHQVMLFNDKNIHYGPPMTADEFYKKQRWGQL